MQVHQLTADAGEAAASYTYNASLGEQTMKESWLVERLGLSPSQVWVFKDFDGGSDVALMDGSTVSIPFFHLHGGTSSSPMDMRRAISIYSESTSPPAALWTVL